MAKKRAALGRGIDALMNDGAQNEAAEDSASESRETPFSPKNTQSPQSLPQAVEADENGTLWVDPELLKPNPQQPREHFDQEELQELSDSIAEHGIVQPILIEDAGDGTFFIIAGERRTRAAKIAGLKKVPVQIRKFNDEKKLEVALIENIQRSDLNPVEEARAYYKLMKLAGLSQEEVAKKVGKGRPTVANALRLLKLPEDMQNSLADGSLTSGHARALLSVEDAAKRRALFKKIISAQLSVRQAEAQAASLNGGEPEKPGASKAQATRDPDFAAIEQKFMETLGTKVQLKGSFDKGQLVIDYFNKDDLNRLYQAIVRE